jgi:hypothetical protein
MNPWLETLGVVLIALSGVGLGRVFSRFRKPYWILGYLVPCLFIVALVISRLASSAAFVPPLVWVSTSRAKFVILAFAVTMGLTTPMSRLPRKCEQVITCILMMIVVAWFSVMPFLVPALIRDHLSNLKTKLDLNGVCFQTTDYTCAPAAAVTVLRRLGLPAQEGEIAILSHTSPVAGTLPACLQAALQNRYGSEGLICRYRYFDSIDQLRQAGPTLAVVKDAFLSDHCVAVLGVLDKMVLIADPAAGRQFVSCEEFEKIWRFTGIVLRRDTTQSI